MSELFNHEIEYRGQKALENFGQPIIICGCGAIGSNLAENLVRQGFTNLTLADFDRVEESNLGTQVYSFNDIGRLKTTALSDILYDINDEIFINTHTQKLEDNHHTNRLFKGGSLLVDCLDNTAGRQLTYDRGGANRPVLHGGLFEDYAECIWNWKYKVPIVEDDGDVCDYPLARNTILLLVAVMSEEIIKWATNDFDNLNSWSITLKDLNISKL